MSDVLENNPCEDMKPGREVETDFNRTVVLSAPRLGTAGGIRRSGVRTPGRKQEIEDLVRGVDVNRYISPEFDVSPDLGIELDAVDAKYSTLSAFAQGGTATISVARDRSLNRLVAIKSLKMDAKNITELLDAFVTEAKITAQLDHPGIIPIHGISRDDNNGIHLVMKLVNGKTLREYLRNITLNYRIRGIHAFDETMQLRKRLEIFLRVCDTIVYAHHRGVIHRDLKPDNIMIGKYMEVFVMDWGLAKVILPGENSFPPVEKISGTPRYFPPEVLRGEPLDFRSDIYTLGLILQEIVTLQYAIVGNSEKELIEHGLNATIEPVEHRFNWKIDRKLRCIIRKATAYKPEDRYQTAEALAEDIRRYMAGLPISVKAENLLDRFLRFVFEHILRFKDAGASGASDGRGP